VCVFHPFRYGPIGLQRLRLRSGGGAAGGGRHRGVMGACVYRRGARVPWPCFTEKYTLTTVASAAVLRSRWRPYTIHVLPMLLLLLLLIGVWHEAMKMLIIAACLSYWCLVAAGDYLARTRVMYRIRLSICSNNTNTTNNKLCTWRHNMPSPPARWQYLRIYSPGVTCSGMLAI